MSKLVGLGAVQRRVSCCFPVQPPRSGSPRSEGGVWVPLKKLRPCLVLPLHPRAPRHFLLPDSHFLRMRQQQLHSLGLPRILASTFFLLGCRGLLEAPQVGESTELVLRIWELFGGTGQSLERTLAVLGPQGRKAELCAGEGQVVGSPA